MAVKAEGVKEDLPDFTINSKTPPPNGAQPAPKKRGGRPKQLIMDDHLAALADAP